MIRTSTLLALLASASANFQGCDRESEADIVNLPEEGNIRFRNIVNANSMWMQFESDTVSLINSFSQLDSIDATGNFGIRRKVQGKINFADSSAVIFMTRPHGSFADSADIDSLVLSEGVLTVYGTAREFDCGPATAGISYSIVGIGKIAFVSMAKEIDEMRINNCPE